jgi:hypothetical protein
MIQTIHCIVVGDHVVGACLSWGIAEGIKRLIADNRAYQPPEADRRNPRWRREEYVRLEEYQCNRQSPLDQFTYILPQPFDVQMCRGPIDYSREANPTYTVSITSTLPATMAEVARCLRENVAT